MNEKATLLNKMPIKRNIYFAIIIILLISFLIAGATYAYFIDTSAMFGNVFTAGTVDVDLDPENYDAHVIVELNGCEEHRWQLKNVGTKSSYVRVKVVKSEIEVYGETAWALDKPDNRIINSFIELDLINKWGWVNEYIVGREETYTLWAGAGQNDLSKGVQVGTVTVETSYDDDNNPESLLVKYILDEGFSMSEAHLHIGKDNPEPPVAPGQFEYEEVFSGANQHAFTIDLHEVIGENEELKLAAHAVVANDGVSQYMYQPSSLGEDCEDKWFWWHEDGDDYGYWYYWDSVLDAMMKVVAGDELELCLLMCPLGSDNTSYDFHIEIEAIQSTNEAYKAWPERVWEKLPVE